MGKEGFRGIRLIGYRCTGKSAVGRRLAERLSWPFYDTDRMIVERIGCTIKTWVEEKGWPAFRLEEKKVIQTIPANRPAVVALGGGAILDPENRERLREKSLVIWLTADLDTILERMGTDPQNQDNRPSLSEKGGREEIEEILMERIPLYQQTAEVTVNTQGKSIEAVVLEILPMVAL
jgi:shikimate kinase